MFVLAHLSDPHLGPLPRPRLAELASKRLLGYANWRRCRHAVHRTDALDAIVTDLRRANPDHVAVTGDLVNIALPFEFERARRWLDSLGTPEQVSVVPGNHDAYVARAAFERERHWAPYMAGDEPGSKPAEESVFPYLRRRGAVALIGLSTAVATPLFMATGRLGAAQIARLAEMLGGLGQAGLFRVIMIHHPPGAAPRHKRLIDAASLGEAIAAGGAELVIHGHDHIRELAWLAGRGAQIPAIGVPSASAAAGARHHAAAYNLYRIAGAQGSWHCEVIARGLRSDGTVAEFDRFDLSWPQRE